MKDNGVGIIMVALGVGVGMVIVGFLGGVGVYSVLAKSEEDAKRVIEGRVARREVSE